MKEISESNFSVHSYEVDAFGLLSARALAGFLQEAAGRSADSLGFGVAQLGKKGLTWVLVRETFELEAPMRMGDDIVVETWPSGVTRRAALRDFRIIRDGREVGRALTSWLVLDIGTRRPVRPAEVLPETLLVETEHVLPAQVEPVPTLEQPSEQRRFDVKFSDIDANRHVTNASYVEWVVEAVSEQTWRQSWLSGLDIQFTSECSLGSSVSSLSSLSASGQGAILLHSIAREHDSLALARARSTWRPKRMDAP